MYLTKLNTQNGVQVKYLILAAFFMVSCGHSHFKTHSVSYNNPEKSDDITDTAASTLISLGYEIKNANQEFVETEVELLYTRTRQSIVEFQTWIKVSVDSNKIEAFCTQRKLRHGSKLVVSWALKKCTNKHILDRVNAAVEELYRVL